MQAPQQNARFCLWIPNEFGTKILSSCNHSAIFLKNRRRWRLNTVTAWSSDQGTFGPRAGESWLEDSFGKDLPDNSDRSNGSNNVSKPCPGSLARAKIALAMALRRGQPLVSFNLLANAVRSCATCGYRTRYASSAKSSSSWLSGVRGSGAEPCQASELICNAHWPKTMVSASA